MSEKSKLIGKEVKFTEALLRWTVNMPDAFMVGDHMRRSAEKEYLTFLCMASGADYIAYVTDYNPNTNCYKIEHGVIGSKLGVQSAWYERSRFITSGFESTVKAYYNSVGLDYDRLIKEQRERA